MALGNVEAKTARRRDWPDTLHACQSVVRSIPYLCQVCSLGYGVTVSRAYSIGSTRGSRCGCDSTA